MQKNHILGIDPGFHGALAIYKTQDIASPADLIEIADMPLEMNNDKKAKLRIDRIAVANFVERWKPHLGLTVIEEVSAMPGQGVTSMFRFGFGAGLVAGIVTANRIPIFFVKPAIWKALSGLSYDKNASIKKAIELFPNSTHLFKLKKHADRAEAALLALFGERVLPHVGKI